MIPEEVSGKPVEIWFQDEARVGQKGTLAYVWARRGTRPRAVQDTRYVSAYLFGAVCPARGVGAGLVMPRANAEALNAHLSKFALAGQRFTRLGPWCIAGFYRKTAGHSCETCLAEIACIVAPGAHAVLVLDGAGWHKSHDLVLPGNISLLRLPPYAPELNPVENIWQYLRGNRLAHRLCATYTDIVTACCEAWNWLLAAPHTITSIASRSWANVSQ